MNRLITFFILVVIISVPLFSQALTVTGRTPDVNAQNIDASTDIEVVFDKNINAATVNETTFNVNGLYTGKITGVYTVTDNRVTFNPDTDFPPGEVITVTLTTALQANDASSLSDGISWQFSIESFISETEFTGQEVISTSADGAQSVFCVDLDGDGDIDVLSASDNDDKIAWYENDGNENFTAHTITTSAVCAASVFSIDLDSDGDMDVLSASPCDDIIAWYENDGVENFTTHTITSSAAGPKSVFSTDLDSDGDMDVLSASYLHDKITWYENDANENFTEHTITTDADGPQSVFSIDLDGDGDMDVLSASLFDDKIAWYENDGNQNFVAQTITTSANGAQSVFSVDLDGDGDMDVLSASFNDDKVAWYENDGNENFTTHTITSSAEGASSVFSVDLDGDSDMDVLSASGLDNKIAWYENDGNENFTTHTITTSAISASSVFSIDFDGDGDMDVLSASYQDDKIAWYENKYPGISANITSSCTKNNDIIFTASSFPYNNLQLIPLTGFQVKNLPDKGYLYFDDNSDGNAQPTELLLPDAILTPAQLDENKLKYKPFADEYGAAYTTFTFKVENDDGWSVETYTVTINVDDSILPSLTINTGATVNKGDTFTFSDAILEASDPDGSANSTTFNITAGPSHGSLFVNGGQAASFTQDDINNRKVTYKHSGNGEEPDAFRFTVSDSDGNTTQEYIFNITVLGNHAPSLTANTGATVSEGGSFTFSDATLKANDPDGDDSDIIYNITKEPMHGSFSVSGALFKTESTSFKQNDIANGKVSYTHSGDEAETDVFRFTVSDNEGGTSPEYNFDITIIGTNEPPVIDSLPAISFLEDEEYSLNIRSLYDYVHDVDTPDSSLSFSFSCENNCIHFSEIENKVCTISSDDNYYCSDSILITISDGEFSCSCSVELIIERVNDLPVINGLPSSVTITNGDVEDINIWDNVDDVETPDSMLTIGFISDPDSLYKYYDHETGMLSIAAMSSFAGEIELTILVIDEDNGVTNETINIVIEEYIDPNPTGIEDINGIPEDIQLSQNYPNPFNPSTVIRYGIPVGDAYYASLNVSLKIYDTLGNEVATLQDGQQSPGFYERTWYAENVSSGIYFYLLRVGNRVESRKMILLK
jgi:hypothetical protein